MANRHSWCASATRIITAWSKRSFGSCIRATNNWPKAATFRYFHDLKLHFDQLTVFPAVLTLRHEIDEKSPLHGATIESLEAERALFFVSVVGIDPVIAAEVQTQKDYTWRDVQFGHRFVEIYHESTAAAG